MQEARDNTEQLREAEGLLTEGIADADVDRELEELQTGVDAAALPAVPQTTTAQRVRGSPVLLAE